MPEEEKTKFSIVSNFFIQTLNGMAYGLFATLIIGTIIATIAKLFGASGVGNILNSSAICLQCLTGAGIGIGIALVLKFDALKTIVIASCGELAAYLSKVITASSVAINNSFKIGDSLTIYIVCIIVALLIKLVFAKKTPVDIILIPLFGIIAAIGLTMLLRTPAIYITFGVQWVINEATQVQPFLMGMIIAVLMGMALTAPISSAAIAAMVFTGLCGSISPSPWVPHRRQYLKDLRDSLCPHRLPRLPR